MAVKICHSAGRALFPPVAVMMAAMIEAGTRKRWRWIAQTPVTHAGTQPHHPLLLNLLQTRGIHEPRSVEKFLDPKLTDLHDPLLMPGMARAAQRMAQAVAQNQRIVVYGDYDVDGVTASSVLWHVLTAAGARVETYVPHRIDEGYGLNEQAIAQLCTSEDPPLIVSVDCGITAVKPAQVAREAGVDLIITDHHEFEPDHLPLAHTLVHPRLPRSEGEPAYPFDSLCGAGVAFKLAWQFAREHWHCSRPPKEISGLLMDLLSLVALGTVADIVPLLDENRVITRHGLGHIKRTRFTGLNALIDAAGLRDEKIDAYHVGFVLGPRLNACGRMGHARDALTLLTTSDASEAARIAEFLTKENQRRQSTERKIVMQAKRMIAEAGWDAPEHRAIVVAGKDWHPGVVGIVASRLVDAYVRPAIVLALDETHEPALAHGSARSVDGVSIHTALTHCSKFLASFGGHAMAAGLKLAADQVDAFRAALVEHINTQLRPEDLVGVLDIDLECELANLDFALASQIEKLAPFGRCNRKPVLGVRGVTLDQPPKVIGSTQAHLKLFVRQGSRTVEALGWNMAEYAPTLQRGMLLDLAFELETSHWQGSQRLELRLCDLRPALGTRAAVPSPVTVVSDSAAV